MKWLTDDFPLPALGLPESMVTTGVKGKVSRKPLPMERIIFLDGVCPDG
jgi:hypothetical protein